MAILKGDKQARFYSRKTQQAIDFVPKAKGDGTRPPTIADARKSGGDWVPSVTSVLKVLAKPELERWKIEQAVLAVMTTPRQPGEGDDAFIERVLNEDRVQEQEMKAAAEHGENIHQAISDALYGRQVPDELAQWVDPVVKAIQDRFGHPVASEFVLIGDGYAGRCDLMMQAEFDDGDRRAIIDFKNTNSIPKSAMWDEHRLQLAAYAKASRVLVDETAIVYISRKNPGEHVIHIDTDWPKSYATGFVPCLQMWKFLNDYQS